MRPCADLALTSLEGWGRVGVGVAAHRPPPTQQTTAHRSPAARRHQTPRARHAPRITRHGSRQSPKDRLLTRSSPSGVSQTSSPTPSEHEEEEEEEEEEAGPTPLQHVKCLILVASQVTTLASGALVRGGRRRGVWCARSAAARGGWRGGRSTPLLLHTGLCALSIKTSCTRWQTWQRTRGARWSCRATDSCSRRPSTLST